MRISEPISMPESEHRQIAELHRLLQLGPPELAGPNGAERIVLPPVIYQILKDVVSNMQRGQAITLMPEDEAVTTQSAADFLACPGRI